MTVFLSDADVRSVFDWPMAVCALRQAYAQGDGARRYPPRVVARGESSWLRTLTGVAADTELMGAKLIAVSLAARSRDETPTLRGTWLRPGVTVVSIGSTLPEQREVDTDVLGRADVIVADVVDEVLHDTGDLIAARAAGLDVAGKTCSLADLVSGRHPGRTDPAEVALYKSVGSAVQDLAIASMCLDAAERLGFGIHLPISIQPVRK